MAVSDTVALIVVIAVVGGLLAWGVGRIAERDKAKRQASTGTDATEERFRRTEEKVPPAPRDATPSAMAGTLGACPTCNTPYRPDIDFCWACGKERG